MERNKKISLKMIIATSVKRDISKDASYRRTERPLQKDWLR